MTNQTRRVYYDTEFLEDGRTIDLISIGMVDDEGHEFYAINRNAPWARIAAHPWLMANVVPHLPQESRTGADYNAAGVDLSHPLVMDRVVIAECVREFILGDMPRVVRGAVVTDKRDPELWAWYGAFDHVALAWLWGPMVALPAGVPMFTCDIRQEAQSLGNPPLPEQADGTHNALADARHNRVRLNTLRAIAHDRDQHRIRGILDRAAGRG